MRCRLAFRGVAVALSMFMALLGAAPDRVAAAERNCLTADERRAVIAAGKAVPLAQAMHLVKAKVQGEVVKVRLCRHNEGTRGPIQGPVQGLVYVLTVLARNGKVLQARVDAADGHWLGAT
jgi:uncharacterized membrane protein YkoI